MDRNYTNVNFVTAIRAVQDGGISIRRAQRNYVVALNAVRRRMNGCVDTDCKRPGSKPFLGHGFSRKEVLHLDG
jgi:helix-turn-helix, Psq domain.